MTRQTTRVRVRRVRARRRNSSKNLNPWRRVVEAELANFELVKAGSSLRLEIFSNAEKIGELEVGHGALYWYGRKRKKRERVDWSRFADMMG